MSQAPSLPPLGPLYGAYYFGSVLMTALYGLTCMQTFFYYVHYPKDPLSTKIFVALLFALNTVHEALTVAGTYKYIMGGLMDPLAFTTGIPELVLQLVFMCSVSIPSQGYLVYKIYLYSGKRLIAPLVWVPLAIIQIVAAFYVVIKELYRVNGVIKVVPTNVITHRPYSTFGSLFLAVAAGTDILIALSMTILLIRARSRTPFHRTARLLQRLVFFSVNTGAWTATFAVMTLVLIYAFPNSSLYAIPGLAIGSVYFNTLIANLNARDYIRSGGEGTDHIIKMDFLSNQGSQATNSTKTDKPCGETSMMVPAGSPEMSVWKSTEVIQHPEVDQTTTSAEEYV